MADGGRIDFTVGFKSDTQGLQQIKTELNELRKITPTMLKEINPTWDMSKARSEFMKVERTINEVSKAFDNAFNPQLGITNIQKLNSSLQKIGIDKIYNQFSSLGTAGTQAFQKLASQALTTNIRLKESSTILDKIGNSLMNTIKWNISSSVVNRFTNSIQQAWGYVKHLDSSLNDIRIVTGKSADEMDRFAEKANKAAKRLGASTTDYTEASLIYYQQGLSDKEVAARAETTIKAANVTGQSGEAVSEQLTAVWNGYKVSAEESELYIDKLAAVAATTASDLEELSTGMSRVASAASIMGVDIDQLNAQLATIVSVTREAPESIGTALKTVYARMSDIKAGLDGEVSLDEYTKQMASMGINVLDANNNLRDMGEVIEEIGGKWQSMSREQQTSLAQTIAGTRQYSRMMALFDNWGIYTKALETSANAAGTLNEQNEIYLESTEAHLQQLRTSIEGVYDSLFDTEGMNDLIDGFTNIVTLFNHFIDGAGGAKTVLMLLGTVGVKAFAKPMQDGLVRLITNFKIAKDNAAQLKAEIELTQALSNSKAMENPLVKQMVEAKQAVQQYYGVMSQADLEQSNALINQLSQAQALEAQWKKDADAYNTYAQQIVNATVKQGNTPGVSKSTSQDFDKFDITKDKNSEVNTEVLEKSSKNVDTILNSTNEELKDIKKLTTEWNKAQAGVNKDGNKSKDIFKDIKNQASIIAKEMLANADIFDALGVDVTKVSALLKKVKIGDPQSVVNFRKELEALVQEAQKTKGQFDNLGDSAKTGLDGAKLAAQQAKAAFDNFLNTQSIKNFSQGLTGTISSIGQLGMGLTSLTNLPKIFDNENLSAGEKFAQILSSLSMGVVSFTTGLSGLIKGIKLITQSIPLATTALKTLNTEQQLALATRLTGNTVTDATVAKNAIETATTWELIKAKAALNAANLIALATAAALLAATFAITAAVNAEKKAREEEAAVSANRSKIAQKNLEKANEEKKKIDELALSYEKLREQERIGEISKADMAKQTAELIDQYGDENTQLIEMTGNYEKLEEAIRNAQAAANEDTISSAQFAQTAAGDKAAGEMWRDMTGAQRDTVKGKRTIDLGTEKDVDEIADVLKEFGDIERLGSGHISLEDVTEAIQTDAQGFIKALEENGSSAATELLSILRATEGLDEAIAAQTSEIGAKIDQINSEEPIKEGSITTVEDFNNAVDSLTEQYVAAGKTEEEAYQMAYDYVSGIDETTKLIGGLNKNLNPEEWDTKKDSSHGALEKNIEVFDKNPYSKSFFNDADSVYKDNIIALQNEVDKIMAQNTAMSVSEAINYALQDKELKEAFSNLPGGENYLEYIKNIASNSLFKGETFEDLQKEASSLSSYNPTADKYRENYYGSQQNEFDYTQLRNDIINAYSKDNPDQAPFLALIENLPQKLYDKGYNTVEEAQGFIDQEIFNTKLANFDNSASNLLAGLQPLLENARYITPDALAQDPGWKDISAYEDVLRVKGLGDEFDTVQDENATEEDRTAALQEIIGYLASISEIQDGLYTKEKAAEEGLTETSLTEQYNKGDITQEQYQQKFQGAMDYELEELGINQDEFDEYTEAVEDLTEQYELSDEMVQRISKDNLKLQKTIDTLTSDWEEYGNILKSGDKNNIKYAQGMGKIRESVEDMFGTDISDDFIQEHLAEIQQLAEGDLTVFDELQKAATQDILVDIQGVVDADQLSGEFAELNELIMNTDLENMEIGTSLDTTGFDVALQSMLDSGALTVDQVNAILAGVGFEPEITWEDVPVEQQSGIANDAHIRYKDSEGNMHEATMQSYLESGETGVIQIPVINGSKTSFKGAPKATTGKKKGGGGGGGGGGGSAAKPDKKDFVDPETDRYHDVEVALKSINKQMEILNDNRKNLTGAALADSYREELELLDEQINALTQKQKLQKEERKELQSQGRDISRDGKKVHIKSLSEQGVEFDDKGNITNYNEAIVNRTNEYNQMVEDYNNLSADRQTDELKAQMDEAKKDYDQFMEDMERYETLTQDEMEETAKEIADALNKKIELKIEKFSMTIDLKLETREAEQRLEDFKSKMEHRDKTAAGRTKTAANKFKNYMDPETGIQAEIDKVNKIKDDIKKMQSGGHSDVYSEYDEESGTWVDNTAKAQEDLKKYTEQMMNDMEDMEDLMDEINQGLLDTFDEIQESFDDQIAGYDAVADQISHNISLIEKLYGDNASDKLGEWYDAQLDNSIGKVDMLKKSADFWQKQMENAENDDAYKKAKENWLKSMNELNVAVEDSLDIVIAKYENSIDQVFDKLNNSLTGGKGLKYVGEEWELINTNADRYLDTINATYEVQKLQGKYQDAINNTDSISAQKKLNDLMSQEMEYLEKKDKLTQYDIDRANMKYDIALKQIALEEAQQNKSSLRLKRDSQGNYSYQYAGDEDDIAKKQQELADAQNSLYNLDKDQYKQNLDDMYTYYSEFQEKMAEVAKTYGRDSEEYEKYKLLYAEQYGKLINNIVTENEYIKLNLMKSTYDELNSLYENDQASFEAMTHMNAEQFLNMDTEMLLDLEERLVPGFNGSIQKMINTFSGEKGFERVMKNVWSEISQAAKDFQTNIQKISKASGTDLEDLKVNTNQILITLKGWVEENDKVIQNAKKSKAAYDKIARGIEAMAAQYSAARKHAATAAKESTDLQKNLNEKTWKKLEAQTALDNLVKKLKEWNNTKPKTKTFVTNYVDNSSGSDSGGSGGNGGSGGGGTSTPKSGSSTVKWYAYGSTGKLSKTGYSSQTAAKNAWPNAIKFLTYKTGGYTGTWANGSREENGKLAFLHQKELVLNEKDTSNFLNAIKEVKSGFNFDNITKAISSQMVDVQRESMRFQNQIARQLNTIIDSIMRIDQSLEQQVNINARFEDVRSSQAIIEAMDQLTNRASQAAFNVRRKW